MMAQPIGIHIQNPSNADWDAMTPAGKGRFCDQCKTQVIDFTSWNDEAIYKFISTHKGKFCGNFLDTQLDRPFYPPVRHQSKLFRVAIALGLTLIFTQPYATWAKGRPPLSSQYLTNTDEKDFTGADSLTVVAGKVVDHNNEPVVNASVELWKNLTIVGRTVTDIDGNFRIAQIAPDDYKIVANFVGYETNNIKIKIAGHKPAPVTIMLQPIQKMLQVQPNSFIRRGGPDIIVIDHNSRTLDLKADSLNKY
jgi:hypothetical protein